MTTTENEIPSDPGEPREYSAEEITHLSVKTIEVYQIQGQLVDRIYAYFNQYCGLLILIGVGAAAFWDRASQVNLVFAGMLALAYLTFAIGNHKALALAMDELILLRNIAVLKTRLQFRGADKGTILRFHLLMIALTLAIYVACWAYVYGYFSAGR
jgi:hypothetical protein